MRVPMLQRFAFSILLGNLAAGAGFRTLPLQAPVVFEENRGQVSPEVRFTEPGGGPGYSCQGRQYLAGSEITARVAFEEFIGSNAGCTAQPVDPTGSWSHYYRGPGTGIRIENVPHYRGVVFHDVWPGVEFAVISTKDGVRREFRVRSVADLARVQIANLAERDRFTAWQGGREISAVSRADNSGVTRFEAPLAGAGPLVLAYPTEARNSSFGPFIREYSVDSEGSVYAIGSSTASSWAARTGQGCLISRTHQVCPDPVIAKFDSAGKLQYFVYLEAGFWDAGRRVEVDAGGNVYVAGVTLSADFYTTEDAYQRNFAGGNGMQFLRYIGGDVFVVKLHGPTGGVIYSTLIGSAATDWVTGFAIDDAGRAFLQMHSEGVGLPLVGEQVEQEPACTSNFGLIADTCHYVVALSESGRDLALSQRVSFNMLTATRSGSLFYIREHKRADATAYSLQAISRDGTPGHSVALPSRPFSVMAAPDGAVWFSAETGTWIVPAGGGEPRLVVPEVIPSGGVVDYEGNLWFLTRPSDRFTPTSDAPLPAECACSMLVALSPSGTVVHATYVPSFVPDLRGSFRKIFLPTAAGSFLTLDRDAQPESFLGSVTPYAAAAFVRGGLGVARGFALGSQPDSLRVYVGRIRARVVAPARDYVIFQVPTDFAETTFVTEVVVEHDGAIIGRAFAEIEPGPMILDGTTDPLPYGVWNEDRTRNSAENPAVAGSSIRFHVAGITGADRPGVRIGGSPVEPISFVQAPDQPPGLLDVRLRVPTSGGQPGDEPVVRQKLSLYGFGINEDRAWALGPWVFVRR